MIAIEPRVTSAQAWLGALPPDGRVFLFQHSALCGTSALAHEEVERYEAANPTTPVYLWNTSHWRIRQDVMEAEVASARVGG